MSSFRCHCFFGLALFASLTTGPFLAHAQNERKTPANNASAKKVLPTANNARSVDLDRTVSFSLTLDQNSKTNILFNGLNKKGVQFTDPQSDKVLEIIKAEFGKESSLDGVVINVAKNVKYPLLNSLFRNIRGAMDENKVSKPIYIAVQDPLAKKNDDQPTTQEFVIKNKKASELYDRVSNVAKLFKVSVRLDPARNSITAKGPASKIKAIQNLVAALDRPAGATTDPSKKIKPIIVEEKKGPTNNSTENNNSDVTPIENKSPSNNGNSENGNSSAGNSDTPRISMPNKSGPANTQHSSSGGPVGKYQMTAVGNNLFLLDTTSGETWILDPGTERMTWIKLPHPKQ